MANARSFPHPLYDRFVLRLAFGESQQVLFPHMISASGAHALMLAETGNLPRDDVAALGGALASIREAGAGAYAYDPKVEDLFFAVEARLIELTGPAAGGNLHIARSRNDLAATMCRMFMRERLLESMDTVQALRSVVLDLASTHVRTLMPGITHVQPAQPTTLGHYLMGVVGPLERDLGRLVDAFDRVNRSPLGAAAFTTTSFAIDRDVTAGYLGFVDVVENGYDAVGSGDHMMESVGALETMCGSLSRFVYDLLVWARFDVGILQIDDGFIQISSIMPQKRNPVVLEHIRTRVAWVYGDATAVRTMIHSAAFGDTNDVDDPIFQPLQRAFDASLAVISLLTAVLETARFDVDLLARRASDGHTTTTAVAEGLVREHGLSFRRAHEILSTAVTRSTRGGEPISAAMINAISAELGDPVVTVGEAFVSAALDPWAFVEARTIPGGPAPSTVEAAIAAGRDRLASDAAAIAERRDRIAAATAARLAAFAAL